MKIAILGTGLMGSPMARVLASKHDLTVWNRSAQRAEALAGVAAVAVDPRSAVEGADLAITMLADGAATRSVLIDYGVLDALAPDSIVIDMASVDPQTDRDIGAAAKERKLGYLDAPVSGGVAGAESGSLSIFVGGFVEDFLVARPVLELMGRPHYVGATGAGQICKLANQLIVATSIGAVAEAFHLAKAAGIEVGILQQALRGGFAESRVLELHGARMVAGDFEPGGRSVAQLKDLRNALMLAADVRADLPLGATVTRAFEDFVNNYDGGELDHSAYYLWLDRRAGGSS